MTLGVLAPYRGLGIGEQITHLPPVVEIMLFDYALDSDTQTIFVNSENERCSNKSA
jgi:pyruvate/2-oxoglutarate/acetoin dehydrogenase E1 component